MIPTIIIIWFLTVITVILSFLLGYHFGTGATAQDTIEAIQKRLSPPKVGPIARPTQSMILERRDPVKAGGLSEFKKLLRNIIPNAKEQRQPN